jgi:hypothetical protein
MDVYLLSLLLNNAGISAINTPSAGFVTCDPTIPLTVTLRNGGSNPLTSVTITVTRNATTIQTFNWTGNLASLATVSVPLNAVPLVLGANNIQVCTSLPIQLLIQIQNDCITVREPRVQELPCLWLKDLKRNFPACRMDKK